MPRAGSVTPAMLLNSAPDSVVGTAICRTAEGPTGGTVRAPSRFTPTR